MLFVGRLTGLLVVLVSPNSSELAAGDSVGMRPAGGVTERVVLPYHPFIAYAEPVAAQVDSFLRTGRFQREEGSDPP